MKQKFYIHMEVVVGAYDARATPERIMASVMQACKDHDMECKITTARKRGTKVNAAGRGRR